MRIISCSAIRESYLTFAMAKTASLSLLRAGFNLGLEEKQLNILAIP